MTHRDRAGDHQALEAVLDDLVEMRDLLRKAAKR